MPDSHEITLEEFCRKHFSKALPIKEKDADKPKCHVIITTHGGQPKEFHADNMLDALAQAQVWRYRNTDAESNLKLYENGIEIVDVITVMTGFAMLTPERLMRAGANRDEAFWILGLAPNTQGRPIII